MARNLKSMSVYEEQTYQKNLKKLKSIRNMEYQAIDKLESYTERRAGGVLYFKMSMVKKSKDQNKAVLAFINTIPKNVEVVVKKTTAWWGKKDYNDIYLYIK